MSRVWAWTGYALAVGAVVYAAQQRQRHNLRVDRLNGLADEYLATGVRRANEAAALRELADERLRRLVECRLDDTDDESSVSPPGERCRGCSIDSLVAAIEADMVEPDHSDGGAS